MPAELQAVVSPTRRATVAALAVITAIAGALRLTALGRGPLDPFYDAAVRSMSLSLRNFALGAYEPGGSVSIDKPPVDLWLAVASVKLFGFGATQLLLPQAICGTLAVPLLFDAVRRACGELAGLCSAAVLALLPIAVLSSRSDTMDSVMMALCVLALWLLVRFAADRRGRWLYLAAVAAGLAFEVKLLEALIALPALALIALLAGHERRWRRLALATATYVVVALSWLLSTLLWPASERPYAIGSTNGSAWNAAFVFNGYDRIAGKATQGLGDSSPLTPRRRPANNSEVARAAVPIGTPSPLRLLDHNGPLSGLRLGFVLLLALGLGVPALIAALRRGAAPEQPFAAGILLWLLAGVVLFSAMARLHPRYTEAFTPAVAAAGGIGIAWAIRGCGGAALFSCLTAAALALYGLYLLGVSSATAWLTVLAAVAVVAIVALPRRGQLRAPALAMALGICALALPAKVAIGLVRHHESDAGRTGVIAPHQLSSLSRYLRANDDGARYELAAGSATRVAALIARDARPVVMLTTFSGRPLVGVASLARLVAAGEVRFALLDGDCRPPGRPSEPACSAAAAWVRLHGTDVSVGAGLPRARLLWHLR